MHPRKPSSHGQTTKRVQTTEVTGSRLRSTAVARGDGVPQPLRAGAQGAPVRSLQERLRAAGYELAADGKFGPRTKEQVRRFQRDQGLLVDGVVGPQTAQALASARPIGPAQKALSELPADTLMRWASAGEGVRRLQTALNARGAELAVDGKYGRQTTDAVREFQQTQGLQADGIAGPKTLGALVRAPGGGIEASATAAPSSRRRVAVAASAAAPAAGAGAANPSPAASQGVTPESSARAHTDGTTGTDAKAGAVTHAETDKQTGGPRIPVVSDAVDQLIDQAGRAGQQVGETVGRVSQQIGDAMGQGLDTVGRNMTRLGEQMARGITGIGQALSGAPQPRLSPQAAARTRGSTNVEIRDLPAGARVDNPLGVEQLRAPKGSVAGSAPMAIFDNPETIHTTGLIGSTIADEQAGRGGKTSYDFPGKGRLYSLVNNRTHDGLNGLVRGISGAPKNTQNSVVAHNPSDKPLTLHIEGTIYSKSITKTDGNINHEYQRNGGFQGPHAITASSYMARKPGENGYIKKTVTIPPKSAAVVAQVPQAPGGEAFTLLDFKGDGKFRLAQAVTDRSLNSEDLKKIVDGSFPTAGAPTRVNSDKGDFVAAGPNELGRPNGVTPGSVFRGGGEVNLTPGQVHGEMFMSTRFKQAEERAPDLLPLAAVPENKGNVGMAARSNDGGFGQTYDLTYKLRNDSQTPARVQVVLTAPGLATDGPWNPAGGMLTMPVKMDGVQHNLRVSARHSGVVIGTVEVPPNSTRDLDLEFTNLGNVFPPAGVELRTLPEKQTPSINDRSSQRET